MRKIIITAIVILAALAMIAATDPLADLKQEFDALKTQVAEMEGRLAYIERFAPVDTFEPIEGTGSTTELATAVNNRILFADGIEIADTGASVITRQSEIKSLPDWARPPSGNRLVAVNVNMYNTSREPGLILAGNCPWETRDTLAIDYSGRCGETMFWNIEVDEEVYPLIGPIEGWFETIYWEEAQDATVSQSTMYFHVESPRPLDGLLTYKHLANPDSHRYWKLKRDR